VQVQEAIGTEAGRGDHIDAAADGVADVDGRQSLRLTASR
jgi:hypothetical protein